MTTFYSSLGHNTTSDGEFLQKRFSSFCSHTAFFSSPSAHMNYSSLSISTTREVKLKKERDRRIEALESQISSLEQW
jgi:hypothetical protein